MCLTTLYVKKPKFDKKVRKGWKIFRCYNDHLYFPLFRDVFLKVGQFLTASGVTLHTERDHVSYPGGFHIFTTLKGTRSMLSWIGDDKTIRIVPILYKGVLARGNQDGAPAVVARFIRIPKNWKKIAKRTHQVPV